MLKLFRSRAGGFFLWRVQTRTGTVEIIIMAAIPRMPSISEITPYVRVFLEAVQKHFYGA